MSNLTYFHAVSDVFHDSFFAKIWYENKNLLIAIKASIEFVFSYETWSNYFTFRTKAST